MTVPSEADRLESLWAGDFGSAYLTRNLEVGDARAPFWAGVLERFPARRVLEVGCTQGDNLRHLTPHLPAHDVWGVDINADALARLPERAPGVNGVWGVGRALPFRDGWFDLTFTVCLLIHQPDDTLPLVMAELVRSSRRWVLCGEYHADERTEVHYRGHDGVLIKRDYGRLYAELFPELTLVEDGYLEADQGFDRVTYQVFEKR